MIQREFYGRPRKLEKQLWPPNEMGIRHESPTRTSKPVHQNFQRVKADIDCEREILLEAERRNSLGEPIYGGVPNDAPQHPGAKSPKDWCHGDGMEKIQEASTAPEVLDNPGVMNGSAASDEDRQ